MVETRKKSDSAGEDEDPEFGKEHDEEHDDDKGVLRRKIEKIAKWAGGSLAAVLAAAGIGFGAYKYLGSQDHPVPQPEKEAQRQPIDPQRPVFQADVALRKAADGKMYLYMRSLDNRVVVGDKISTNEDLGSLPSRGSYPVSGRASITITNKGEKPTVGRVTFNVYVGKVDKVEAVRCRAE